MDYGKLAYQKAEDAEKYIRKKAAEEGEEKCVSAVSFPHAELNIGYTPIRISGTKSVGVMASMRVSATKSVSARISVTCGEKLCSGTTVTLESGEEKRFTLFFSAYPGSGENVRLICDKSGVLLEEVNFLAVGANAKITLSGAMSRADFHGDDIYVLCEQNGYVVLTSTGTDKSVSVAHGSTFDIAVSLSGISVAVSDDSGNALGVLYDFELNEVGRGYLDAGFEKIAVGRHTVGLVLAGIRGGKIYMCYCAEDFSDRTDWEETDFVKSADDVYFSKQTDSATLFIRRGDGLYAKLAVPECGAHSSLKIVGNATFD